MKESNIGFTIVNSWSILANLKTDPTWCPPIPGDNDNFSWGKKNTKPNKKSFPVNTITNPRGTISVVTKI